MFAWRVRVTEDPGGLRLERRICHEAAETDEENAMNDNLFSVVGQVVLVSGASRGIGRAIAAGFAERGAKVVITGRQQATLARTAKEINAAAHVVCDVADPKAINTLVETVLGDFGHIDTLINVAGVNRRKTDERLTEDEWEC